MGDTTLRRPDIPDHEVLRPIGRGAYGEIWLARSLTGALRAVKVISRSTFASERSFQREFDGMSAFEPISRSHNGFVDILHVGRGEGFFYYIMELADDSATGDQIDPACYRPKTLKSLLDTHGRLPASECLDLGLSLTDALQSLHDRGLTHRDIKPSNIIFVHGQPKLADIGLVALSGQESFVGTEGYVPPEGPGAPPADIFSLGKVLYEITMGKDRLEFPEVPTQLEGLEDKEHVLELNEILLKACAGKLKRRYGAARDMHADLVRLKRGRRRRTLLPIYVIGALLIAGAGLYAATRIKPPAPAPTPVASNASISITTQPAEAMVFLDNRVKHSPATFSSITPGTHHLRIVLSGYEPIERALSVAAGDELKLPTFPLVQRVGSLRILSEPPGAELLIRFEGKTIGKGAAPLTLEKLPEGEYEISGSHSGQTTSSRVTVAANEQTTGELKFLPGNGSVKITSAPGGATVILNGEEIGVTPLLLEEFVPGEISCQIRLHGYKESTLAGTVEAQRRTFLAARLERTAGPEPGKGWTNSLGMPLVPVGSVRFCVWETRVRDYAAFCTATSRMAPLPDFPQTPEDPVVMVNWDDAMEFCHWLTEKERGLALISEKQHYRLPTDAEWSAAAGLPPERGNTPESRDGQHRGAFPWGTAWPPPEGTGNYADQSLKSTRNGPRLGGYNDGSPQTSPAGKFPANSLGIHDLGGNVWEWCLEGYKGEHAARDWGVLRGGSWANAKKSELESSYRNVVDRGDRDVIYGFRCVLAEDE
jgi:serine/threonine protein kinase